MSDVLNSERTWQPEVATTVGGAKSEGWRATTRNFCAQHFSARQGHGGRWMLASHRTMEHRAQVAVRLIGTLRGMGFRLSNPSRLRAVHAQALVNRWCKEFQEGKLKSKTIAGYASVLRQLLTLVGRRGGLEAIEWPDLEAKRCSQVAEADRSWEAANIDFGAAFEMLYEREPWVAMAMLLQCAFGLRRKEAVMVQPCLAVSAGVLRIERGAKGGRARAIPIHTPFQAGVLALAREWVMRLHGSRGSTLAPAGLSLRQALSRYSYVMGTAGFCREGLGVTGHGMRNGFACRMLEAWGVVASVRGGAPSELPAALTDAALRATSEALGHSRPRIVSAYAGSMRSSQGEDGSKSLDGVDAARIDVPRARELMQHAMARLDFDALGRQFDAAAAKANRHSANRNG